MTERGVGSIERTTRNMAWLLIAQATTASLALAMALVLPRHLGSAAIGRLFFAQSLWLLAGVVAAFGTHVLITKIVAREPDRAAVLVGQSIMVRLSLLLAAWAAVMGFLWSSGHDGQMLVIAALVGIAASFGVISETGRAALHGLEMMRPVSIADMVTKVFLVAAVLVLIAFDAGVVAVSGALAVAAAIGLVIIGSAARRRGAATFWASPRTIPPTLALAAPYVLFEGSRVLYQQVDTLVIALLVDDATVGWYGTADQIFTLLLFVPTIAVAALFPAFARLPGRSESEIDATLTDAVTLILAGVLPMGLGLMAIGPNLATMLFGEEYRQSGSAIALFGIALVPTAVSVVLGHAAVAMDGQGLWLKLMLAAAAATVVLDVILVPLSHRHWGNGAIGGAFSYVVTETVIVAIGLWRFRPSLVSRPLGVTAAKLAVAGGVMVSSVWWIRDLPMAVPVIVGAVVYGGALASLRVIRPHQVVLLRSAAASLTSGTRVGRAT